MTISITITYNALYNEIKEEIQANEHCYITVTKDKNFKKSSDSRKIAKFNLTKVYHPDFSEQQDNTLSLKIYQMSSDNTKYFAAIRDKKLTVISKTFGEKHLVKLLKLLQ